MLPGLGLDRLNQRSVRLFLAGPLLLVVTVAVPVLLDGFGIQELGFVTVVASTTTIENGTSGNYRDEYKDYQGVEWFHGQVLIAADCVEGTIRRYLPYE